MTVDNPNACCGESTTCCGEHVIPDRLTATVETSCGVYTSPLVLVSKDSTEIVWQGTVNFECQSSPGAPCTTRSPTIQIKCQLQGAEWGVTGSGGGCGVIGANSVSCPPFLAVLDILECSCIDEPPIMTVTE